MGTRPRKRARAVKRRLGGIRLWVASAAPIVLLMGCSIYDSQPNSSSANDAGSHKEKGNKGEAGDSGGGDAGGGDCKNNLEICDGKDNDCDGETDEDPAGAGCRLSHATASCSRGRCAVAKCDDLFGDCDDDPANGCETPLDMFTDCGKCGRSCADVVNATDIACDIGGCVFGACNVGYDDCDGDKNNGCEQKLDTLSDCGACGVECKVSVGPGFCTGGACTEIKCLAGNADCDKDPSNGCEASLSSEDNCGFCGNKCQSVGGATTTCKSGSCQVVTHDAGAYDCAQGPLNGSDASLSSFSYTPSNFNPADLSSAVCSSAAVTLNCGVSTFDSKSLAYGNWCGQTQPTPIVKTQSGGPDVVIIPLRGLTVTSGATLKLSGDRPVILAVFGDATVAGTVDASASGATAGAGGNWNCGTAAGGNGSGQPDLEGSGGGGGGFGTKGGAGGGPGGAAGVARGNATLVPLMGGCSGGKGGGNGGNGGAGGGAVQISASGTLTVVGAVKADGGAGSNYSGNDGGGGGGGSGGAILLECDTVKTTGSTITADGGNGGNGENGDKSGNGSTSSSSNGSNGSGDAANGASGGGGGYGRVLINQI